MNHIRGGELKYQKLYYILASKSKNTLKERNNQLVKVLNVYKTLNIVGAILGALGSAQFLNFLKKV